MRFMLLFAACAVFFGCSDVPPVEHLSVTGGQPPAAVQPALDAPLRRLMDWNAGIYWADVARWSAATEKPEPRPVRVAHTANHGPHSDAFWHGVSVCEQGGRNDPYFGYFSIMDGSAGGLDWGTQVAMANRIISRYGDGAWAASCVAAGYRASPGG